MDWFPADTEVGFTLADAPVGTPLIVSATVPAPLVAAVLMVEGPLVPCTSVSDVGLAPIEKSFAAVTVSPTVVLCVALVPVPVIVIVEVAAGVVALVVIVRVELPPLVTVAGLNEALAPLGRPLAESDTLWADPLVTVVLIAVVPC